MVETDNTKWQSQYGLTVSPISTPSNFISGTFASFTDNGTSAWSLLTAYVNNPKSRCRLSCFVNLPNNIHFYFNLKPDNTGAQDKHFTIDAKGNITNDCNAITQKVNGGYIYIEFDVDVDTNYFVFGTPDRTTNFSGIIGNLKLIKLDVDVNQGSLIEGASSNYCSGDTPTTSTNCNITPMTYLNQTAWLIESPDVDQWSNILIPHTNTNTSLTCVGSVYVKVLEDGELTINNGTTYNSSFTFSNGECSYNGDGGGPTINAGCDYIGNGIWRLWQIRNDGFIFNSVGSIGLQNTSTTAHFPKFILFCAQLEESKLSSWIPYGSSRDAD